jgi:exoribonuclease-2
MNQGKIVEYIEAGNIVTAVCLLEDGNKLHLLTPTNREVNLSPKRALFISDPALNTHAGRDDLLSRLKTIIERRSLLREQVQVKDIWELVRDEHEVFDFKYLAQLCFGEGVTDDHISALVRAVFEDKLYFKLKDGAFLPNSETRIELVLREKEEAEQREKRLQEGSRWLKRVLEGKAAEEPLCKEEIIDVLTELALYREDAPDHKFGKELLSRSGINDVSEVRNLLVRLGIWEEDENLDLLRLKVRTSFTKIQLEESCKIAQSQVSGSGREDLREWQIFTIDGPLTRDFDDALSLDVQEDALRLGIHIADVGSVIPVGSLLDQVAEERGTSLYLARRQIPMLPPLLSQDALSLKKDVDRPAVSLICRLDRDGNLLDSRFTLSLVRVKRQLSYDEVDELYQGDESLSVLHRLSAIMRQQRIENGAMLLPLPEVYAELGEEGEVSIRLASQETPSKLIVSELMIFYNWMAARYCRDHRIPALYRCQAPPSEIVSLDGVEPLYAVLKQRGKLSPLEIDVKPRPHSGLGMDAYTNVSSPIRRYFDLVIQRQIIHSLLEAAPPYTTDELDKKRMVVEPMLRDLERLKRNRLRYWILKWLRRESKRTFGALILAATKTKYRIALADSLLITELKRQNGQDLHEGQRILVRVRKVDPWEDILRLEYAGNVEAP